MISVNKIIAHFAALLMMSSINVSVVNGQGQSSNLTSTPGAEDDFKRLYFLNNQYIQSWIKSDTATYDNLLWAEDFVHQNGADGKLIPKRELMSMFGQPRFEKIEYFFPENVKIQFITNDVAMIFARTPFKMIGRPGESLSQYNDVYVKRNGRWICVAANITQITQSGTAPATFSTIPEAKTLMSFYQGSEEDRKTLLQLNEKHAEAFMRSKVELAQNIFADDYVLLSTNGLLYSKTDVLDQIGKSATQNQVEHYSIANATVRFVSQDVAMIHAAALIQLKNGSSRAVQYNDIYVKRNEAWVCVSGNDTPIRN